MNSDIEKKVKIYWNDVVNIYPKRKGDVFSLGKEKVVPTQMETTGILIQDREEGLLVKDPKTIKILTGEKHPEKDPAFYLIPRGMITRIEYLN